MGDSTREAADRLHLLSLAELFFQLFAFSCVAGDNHQPIHGALSAHNRARPGFEDAPTSVLVAHAVFDTLPQSGDAGFERCSVNLLAIIRMDMFDRSRTF